MTPQEIDARTTVAALTTGLCIAEAMTRKADDELDSARIAMTSAAARRYQAMLDETEARRRLTEARAILAELEGND
jgi:hypothetical protein